MIKQRKSCSQIITSFALLILCACLGANQAFAEEPADQNKIDILVGYYSLSIKNKSTSETTSFSSMGADALRYRRSLLEHFDMGVGYSFFTRNFLSGDSYYGIDLFAQYYPLTSSSTTVSTAHETRLQISEKLRPYVGIGFHQRSFQGIQTSYVGFSGSAGVDYALSGTFGLIFNIRYMGLNATTALGGHETSALAGVSFGF